MIVSHIWDAEYPWDIRVEKVSSALMALGHQVHILARNRHARQAVESLPEGMVHRLPWWTIMGSRLNAASQFPAFFNPRWIALIDRTVRQTQTDVVLCRDLPLAPSAVLVARARRIPVVFDMAENYPAMIADLWVHGRPRAFDGLVRNPRMARMVEKWVVKRADHILVVVEESRRRLIDLGVAEDRITVVSNTPANPMLRRPTPRPTGAHARLIYVGQLDSATRGVGVVLNAIAACRQRGHSVRLTVVGDGLEKPMLERQAEALALSPDQLRFTGRLPHAEAIGMLGQSHVGVVPHLATEHSNTTVPNKVFDYMAAGLAVVVSDARPLARIATECACGAVAVSGDSESMTRAIEEFLDEEYRLGCAHAGRMAVQETYNWARDADRLGKALESVVIRRSSRSAA